jgi:hypothetical protein
MPALFAYLIAVGLLLGGGYGALNWLAAPEPVKVAARAKPAPHREARPEATSQAAEDSGASSAGPGKSSGSDEVAARSNEVPPSPSPETTAAATEPSVKTEEISGAAQTQQEQAHQEQAVNAETPPADVKPSAETAPPAQAVSAPSPGNQQIEAAPAPAPPAKPVKRLHQRQAGGRPEKPALALMTLRTIEYADGRRVTQLIPYRSPHRAPAFGPDD